jgi:hypothetical protein
MQISSSTIPTSIYDRAVIDDLLFLQAWEKGLIPWWSGTIVRVRQIRNANLALRNADRDSEMGTSDDTHHLSAPRL